MYLMTRTLSVNEFWDGQDSIFHCRRQSFPREPVSCFGTAAQRSPRRYRDFCDMHLCPVKKESHEVLEWYRYITRRGERQEIK
jgi:hypothetical protein